MAIITRCTSQYDFDMHRIVTSCQLLPDLDVHCVIDFWYLVIATTPDLRLTHVMVVVIRHLIIVQCMPPDKTTDGDYLVTSTWESLVDKS